MAIFEADQGQSASRKQEESGEDEDREISLTACVLEATSEAYFRSLRPQTRLQKMVRAVNLLRSYGQLSISAASAEIWPNTDGKNWVDSQGGPHVPASLCLSARGENSSFPDRAWAPPAPGFHRHLPRGPTRHLLLDPVHPAQVPHPSRDNEISRWVLENLDSWGANLSH